MGEIGIAVMMRRGTLRAFTKQSRSTGRKSSRSDVVVLSHSDKWYNLRILTGKEVDEFVADLVRADMANLRVGCVTPH
jgi:hypothetical protein